jgi:hypothetical protein
MSAMPERGKEAVSKRSIQKPSPRAAEACAFLARSRGYVVRMKISISILLALFTAPGLLRANIGETETAIKQRYGDILGTPFAETNRDISETFKYKDYIVVVKFLDGTSQRESFTRKDKQGLSEKELDSLLAANANGGKWVQMNDNKDVKIWVLESREGFAGYYKSKPYLSIQTREMLGFDEAVKAAREKQAGKR